MLVQPAQVHEGDPVYVSGSGFPPKSPLLLSVGCPNFQFGAFFAYVGAPQPTKGGYARPFVTDKKGNFAGLKLLLGAFVPMNKLPIPCRVNAAYAGNPQGTDFPAIYEILPADTRLDKCARQMCVRVAARPKRVKQRLSEQLQVTGWPGARATVTVRYPHMRPWHKTTTLDWRGVGTVKWSANISVPKNKRSQRVSVQVRASLDAYQGAGYSAFLVIQ